MFTQLPSKTVGCFVLVLWMGPSSTPALAGPRIELVPVSANVPHVINGDEILLAPASGIEVTLEIRYSGWSTAPGSPMLVTAQAKMDSNSYLGDNASPPNPGLNLVPKGYALPNPSGGNRKEGAFLALHICETNLRPCDGTLPACTPSEGECVPNPRFVFSCCPHLAAVDTSTLNYRFGVATHSGSAAPDPGDPDLGYGGTLILTVPSAALGTYTIDLDTDPFQTFMMEPAVPHSVNMPGVVLAPARITIAEGCDDGNPCTTGVGIPGDCTFLPSFDTATGCCDPTDGTITTYDPGSGCCNPSNGSVNPLDDGNDCTTDTCNTLTGAVQHSFEPAGTPCGSGSANGCTQPGVCNGAGSCSGGPLPNGTPCSDANACTVNDACMNGVCVGSSAQAEGLACDDGQTCTGNDRCTAGQCVGTPADANGSPCDDGNACTTNDVCDNGVCAGVNSCVPTAALQPVSSSGPYSVVGNDIFIRDPGVTVTLEARFYGWGSAPGSANLKVAQATMDSARYLGANAEPPNPGADLVPMGYAQPDPNGGNRAMGFYVAEFVCSANARRCGPGQTPCTSGEGACIRNPRFFLHCCDWIVGINTTGIDYSFGATTVPQEGAPDPQDPYLGYAATIVLEVPPDADGTYTVALSDSPNETFMFGPGELEISGLTLIPARIIVTHTDPAPALAARPYDQLKNRYVTFEPNYGEVPVAYQIALEGSDLLSGPFGVLGWVGPPDANGLSSILPPATPLATATRVWTEPAIHVGDCAIAPRSIYAIRATEDGIVFSPPREFRTIHQPTPKQWGDTVGSLVGGTWSAPNGTVNTNDFLAALQKFQNLATAPHAAVVDVQSVSSTDPCLNRVTNIADVFLLIQAFQGSAYPFVTDVASCPPCP